MELHITRAAAWMSSAAQPISVEEWRAAGTSVGLERRPGVTGRGPSGEVIDFSGEFAWWHNVLFSWVDGRVDVSGVDDADESTLRMFKDLAQKLSARLVDDGDVELA